MKIELASDYGLYELESYKDRDNPMRIRYILSYFEVATDRRTAREYTDLRDVMKAIINDIIREQIKEDQSYE